MILAIVVVLGVTPLVVCVDTQAQIAFVSDRDGNDEIYVMDANGEELRKLTNNRFTDGQPSWSPDGKQIAFESDRERNYEIYVMDIDGDNPRKSHQ